MRVVNRCPICNEVLKEECGIVTCACESQSWGFDRAERGTEIEEKLLADNGFEFASDIAGDLYYVGPFCHIIHLYPGSEWDSDKAPTNLKSLEEYLAWLARETKL
jgi:hypothetical protein